MSVMSSLYRSVRDTFKNTRIGRDYFRRKADQTYNELFPSIYAKAAAKPLDKKKVIFLEMAQPRLTNNLQLLHDRIVASGRFTVHCHYLRTNFVSGAEWRRRCTDFLEDLGTTGYLFLTEGSKILSCLTLRPGTVVTQTWHGCGAFKKFGFSTVDARFGGDRALQTRHPMNRNYTYVTVSSPEVVWAYVEAMQLQGYENVVKPVGVSRTDVFFDKEKVRAARKDVCRKFPAAQGKKIILYAPTFRGNVENAKAPGKLDIPAMQKALGGEYALIIKQHPLVKQPPEIAEQTRDTFACEASKTKGIDELLMAADICISDYSSLIFEYSLMERPMIFFAYDLEDYFDDRGFYYDYGEMTPGPVCRTTEEIIDYIEHIGERFDPQQVRDFRQRFMSACDGHATDRILDMVFGTNSVSE